jgi:glycosyltransferase involved in cell wall biosynthesis
MKLSIIIPCKNESRNILELYRLITDILGKIKYELIFVDDGSNDDTLDILKKLYNDDVKHIKILSFSRNFKMEAAVLAGLEHSIGEYTCVINGNLKYNPKYIFDMFNFLEGNSDYDSIAMVQKNQKESLVKKMSYKLMMKLCDINEEPVFSNYRMFRKNVKESLINSSSNYKSFCGLFAWIGFKTKILELDCEESLIVKSNKDVNNCIRECIFAFSDKPLTWSLYLGLMSLIASLLYLVVVIIQVFAFDIKMKAVYALIILMLLLFGLQFIIIGLVGKYLALINDQVKNRPVYIIKDKIGFSSETIL